MKNRFLSGQTVLSIEGLNLDRFLNLLVNNDIRIYDLNREGHKKMTLSVSHKNHKMIKKIAENKPYEIKILSSFGLPACLLWARTRIALLISMVVVFAAVAAFNGFIWEVRIVGLDEIPLNDVQNALSEVGVKRGLNKNNFERKKVETAILASLPKVSYVNAYCIGITLFVEIIEALPKQEAIDNSPSDITAVMEGTITRIVTISGTPAVRVGDKVSAGQVLISRYVTYADGTTQEVRSDGEVYAEVVFTGEAGFFGSEESFLLEVESLKQKALNRAINSLPSGSCLIDTKYDIISTAIGKTVRAILLVEMRIDS